MDNRTILANYASFLIEMYSSDILAPKDRKKMVERFVQLFGLAKKRDGGADRT